MLSREEQINKVAEALQITDNTATSDSEFLVNFVSDEIWWDRIAKVAIDTYCNLVEEEVNGNS